MMTGTPDGATFEATIAITNIGTMSEFDGWLVLCPDEYKQFMDGPYLCDNMFTNIPKIPGCYAVKVEVHFQQGYFEGYRADGESDWEFEITEAAVLTNSK